MRVARAMVSMVPVKTTAIDTTHSTHSNPSTRTTGLKGAAHPAGALRFQRR
jgi:hypothetical protein